MRKIQLFFATILIAGSVYGITTDSLFINMPDKLLPTLLRKQRFEMTEYFKAGQKDSVRNIVGSNALLIKYDAAACHIIIQTSATGSSEIKRFVQLNGDTIIGFISTVQKPVKYSYIAFYTEKWVKKDIKMDLPNYEKWLDEKKLAEASTEISWIKTLLDTKYYSYSFSESNELIIENNVLNTLNNEDRKLVEPFFIHKGFALKLQL